MTEKFVLALRASCRDLKPEYSELGVNTVAGKVYTWLWETIRHEMRKSTDPWRQTNPLDGRAGLEYAHNSVLPLRFHGTPNYQDVRVRISAGIIEDWQKNPQHAESLIVQNPHDQMPILAPQVFLNALTKLEVE